METILFIIGFGAALLAKTLHPDATEPAGPPPAAAETAADEMTAGEAPAENIERPASLDVTLPDDLLHAERAAKISLEYAPAANKQTYYFTAEGEKTEQAADGGYYREILGQTADGRIVAQDYYQNGGKPQTAPFILMKDGVQDDFSNNTMDSKVVWYREDGSIFAVQEFRDGKEAGRMNVYENGRLAAQMPLSDGIDENDPYAAAGEIAAGLRLFYPSGKLMAIIGIDGDNRTEILYRENGSPLFTVRTNIINDDSRVAAWDENGEPVRNPADKIGDITPIQERQEHLLDMLKNDSL